MAKENSFERIVASAINAAEELGRAAGSLKESWEHIAQARAKGTRASSALRGGVKRVTKGVAHTAKRILSRKK
jgi:hypothetical protein